MRRILFSCIFLIQAVSCADKNAALLLDKAEHLMEAQPEYAMAILDSLHSEGIRGRENNARYALLYSIALDKNYIDETDDSLVNIAVNWYKRHGTADEKLKTWYYKGRVHQNAGDNETAMESFVTAEQWADKTDDLVTTGMLYSAKAAIYQNLFNFDIALLNRQNAAKNYKSAKDTSRYINAVISITLNNIINNKVEDIKKNIDTIKNYWESLNINQKSGYYSILLFKNDIQEQDFDIVIQDYLRDVTDSMQINWLRIGEIYCQYNKNDKALECLETYRKITPGYENNAEYHLINAAIKDSTGRYEEALRAYQKYIEITDEEDIGIFESDTKFVEDRELLEYKVRIQKNRLWIMFLSIVIIILSAIMIGGKIRAVMKERIEIQARLKREKKALEAENERYRNLYKHAVNEKKQLQKLGRNSELDPNVKEALNKRLEVLNTCITDRIAGNLSKEVSEKLDHLMKDKEEFLNSTRMSFMVAHPHFISYLHKAGLTEWEIGCCCLYCMGLNGNDIMSYLERNSFYNDSSIIRNKLGLKDSHRNLATVLRQKMKETDA